MKMVIAFYDTFPYFVEKLEIHCHANYFRQINLEKISLVKVTFTKFLRNNGGSKNHNFHTVDMYVLMKLTK